MDKTATRRENHEGFEVRIGDQVVNGELGGEVIGYWAAYASRDEFVVRGENFYCTTYSATELHLDERLTSHRAGTHVFVVA